MADEGRNPLELEAVVRRFAESAQALANVKEQLQALSEFREAEERVNASLHETAGQVARFTGEAATILKGLEEAQAKVAAVLQSGADLLDGTELKGITETVKANAQSISAADGRINALDAKVTELLDIVGALQARMGQDMESLTGRIDRVHADVLTPIIVKRLWGGAARGGAR